MPVHPTSAIREDETAAVLLHTGRAADDPAVTERLLGLGEEIGLSTMAELWSSRPARTLPGVLWRLYLLREWVESDPDGVAREYAAGIRFTHSPSGGGANPALQTTNPAWDFQFLVPKPEVMKEYGFRVRTVLRPRCSRAELLAEFSKWKGTP